MYTKMIAALDTQSAEYQEAERLNALFDRFGPYALELAVMDEVQMLVMEQAMDMQQDMVRRDTWNEKQLDALVFKNAPKTERQKKWQRQHPFGYGITREQYLDDLRFRGEHDGFVPDYQQYTNGVDTSDELDTCVDRACGFGDPEECNSCTLDLCPDRRQVSVKEHVSCVHCLRSCNTKLNHCVQFFGIKNGIRRLMQK